MINRNTALLSLTLTSQLLFAGTMGDINTGYDFGGFYVGLQAGALTLIPTEDATRTTAGPIRTDIETSSFESSYTGVMFNGNVGYGAMYNQVYFGGKGSITYGLIQYSNINTASQFAVIDAVTRFNDNTSTSKRILQPFYNIDAVLGYEIVPHVLPYIEGGVSFTNLRLQNTATDTYTTLTGGIVSTSQNMDFNSYKTGYNLGLGVNYQPAPHWILTTECSYTSFGNISGTTSATIPGSTTTLTYNRSQKAQSVGLLAGVTYLF